MLTGSALVGSLAAFVGAAASTPALAECVRTGDNVVCSAGAYPGIAYTVPGALSLTLEDGVTVDRDGFYGVQISGGLDLAYTAGPGTSVAARIEFPDWTIVGVAVDVTSTAGSIDIDSYDAEGGVTAYAPGGAIVIDSVSADASERTDGILTGGIVATARDAVTITSQDASSGASISHAILGVSHEATVSITSLGLAENLGAVTGAGIGGVGRLGVTIDAATVRTSGAHSLASGDLPTLDIVNGEFVSSVGIHGRSVQGDVSIASDDILTLGDGGFGIFARARTGDVAIDSAQIATQGAGAAGIVAHAGQDIQITSGAIATTGDSLVSTSYVGLPAHPGAFGMPAAGIWARSDNGAVDIDSASIVTAGGGAVGILTSSRFGATIVSGYVSTSGELAQAIIANNNLGDVVIDSGEAHASGAGAGAISANAFLGGSIHIDSDVATATYAAISAHAFAGEVHITSGSVEVSGEGSQYLANGISANASGRVVIDSGSVVTHGNLSFGIAGVSGSGVEIVSGSVETTGQAGGGIGGFGQGDVSITSGTIVTTGGPFIPIDFGTGLPDLALGATPSAGMVGESLAGAVDIASGSISTQGDYAFGLMGRALAGTVTVESGSVATSGDGATGVLAIASGDVSLTSGSATTSGDSVHLAGLGLGTYAAPVIVDDVAHAAALRAVSLDGTVSVASGSVATEGLGAAGIFASGAAGVSVISGDAATGGGSVLLGGELVVGDAIHAVSSGGGVTVVSGVATAMGPGARGIHVAADGDVAVTAANTSAGGGALEDRIAHAVFASSASGSIGLDIGAATAAGEGASGIFAVAQGEIDLHVSGLVSAAHAAGVRAEAGGSIVLDIAATGSVTGAVGVELLTGESAAIVNRGAIEGVAGVALDLAGARTVTLVNTGALIGSEGVAVQLGEGDDHVRLGTGSHVVGSIDGGDGRDIALLSGSAGGSTIDQSLAHFVAFERLEVSQGHWTAGGPQSAFSQVAIASGAALEIRDGDAGALALAAGGFVNDGLLAFDVTGDVANTDDLLVSGQGVVALTGPGTLHVTSQGLAHTGGTVVEAGTLILTGALQGGLTIREGGTFQLGDGGVLGVFQGDIVDNGTLIFDRSDDYEFTGALSGSGDLVKRGDSELFLSGDYAFRGRTTVLGGSLKLANLDPTAELEIGAGSLDLSGGEHTIGGLSGDGGELNIDNGSLTIDQTGSSTFGGVIAGDGDLIVAGGVLNLTGDNTYTGDTTVGDGVLKVNGSVVSDIFVEAGGALGGNGQVADVDVGAGGTVGPGNSIGLLTVIGDVAFGPGSFYEVEVDASGQGDRIAASGQAILTGGAVTVLAQAGAYDRLTTYSIIEAAGGVTGTFDAVTSNLAYLTPRLRYTADEVLLTLARNDIAFASLATGANASAVAEALEAGGDGDDLYEAVLLQSDDGARQAFDALSGEFHGAVATALLADTGRVREATLSRLHAPLDGAAVWADAYGTGQRWNGDGAAAVRRQAQAIMAGVDVGMDGWRLGAAAGYARGDAEGRPVRSEAETESVQVTAYGGLSAGPWSVKLGAAHAWHDIQAERAIAFPGFTSAVEAGYEAVSSQGYVEAAYAIRLAGGMLQPFASVAAARLETDAFAEDGGPAALAVAASTRDVVFSAVGARLTVDAEAPGRASPFLSLAWGHASGDLEGVSRHAFASGQAFAVSGASLDEDSLLAEVGLDWRMSDGASLGLSYRGAMGETADDHAVRAVLSMRF